MTKPGVSVVPISSTNQQKPKRAIQAEILNPVEHLQQRLDEAFDRSEALSALIQSRQSQGLDCSSLLAKLKEAEADKRAALANLRKVRWMMVGPSV